MCSVRHRISSIRIHSESEIRTWFNYPHFYHWTNCSKSVSMIFLHICMPRTLSTSETEWRNQSFLELNYKGTLWWEMCFYQQIFIWRLKRDTVVMVQIDRFTRNIISKDMWEIFKPIYMSPSGMAKVGGVMNKLINKLWFIIMSCPPNRVLT